MSFRVVGELFKNKTLEKRENSNLNEKKSRSFKGKFKIFKTNFIQIFLTYFREITEQMLITRYFENLV
jgi:hypothetical protein